MTPPTALTALIFAMSGEIKYPAIYKDTHLSNELITGRDIAEKVSLSIRAAHLLKPKENNPKQHTIAKPESYST